MSIIATAVRHLIAAGVTGDALCAAIAEMEADIRAEPKPRSAGAIRQARYREAKRNEASQVTESDACDASDVSTPLSAPPNDIYSNPPHHTPQHSSSGRDAFPCPDWCDPAVWRDLKRNRKAKNLANTETAHRLFLREIAKFVDDEWPPGRLVEAIVAKGWGGAYDPREASGKTGKSGNGRQGNSGNSNANAARLALEKLGLAN